MAGETIITVVGNLTADPELRYTQNGLAVANFTIASTPRTFDRQANEWKDGEALFVVGPVPGERRGGLAMRPGVENGQYWRCCSGHLTRLCGAMNVRRYHFWA